MRKIMVFVSALSVLWIGRVSSQQAPPQKEIDQAIEKGADYLEKKYAKGIPTNINEFELVVYTLIHAESNPQKDPLKKGIHDLLNHVYPLKDVKKGREERTNYRIAIRALALHSLLVKIKNNTYYLPLKEQVPVIQKKIAESAQYLVDTQLDNGQWTYAGVLVNTPEISTLATGTPPPESEFNKTASKAAWENASNLTGTLYKLIPKYGADPKNKGTDLGKPVELGKQHGDNSNTQYGVLGLIAAEMSGVEVPRTTWELVMKWFESAQNSDGGFGYHEAVETPGTAVKPKPGTPKASLGSYGSMTTAGAVALAAAYKFLGRDYKKEARFKDAVKWQGEHFSVTENPEKPGSAFLYYMYGLERVGAFSGLQKFGAHDWYAEGAAQLLKTQKADGSWSAQQKPKHWAEETATPFAILFLKRATSDIISGGGGINAR